MLSTPTTPVRFASPQAPVTRARGAQSRHPAPQVQFAGVGDIVSSFIGVIDRSRPLELFSSDVGGMLTPRAIVAAIFRGGDDARETLIREGTGVVCVALLAGLSNQAMIYALGNRVGLYNPHGTPAKAWISAKNLRVFSELYDKSLNQKNSIPEVRENFIAQVLGGLESGDRKLSIEGRLSNLKSLQATGNHTSAEALLTQMVKEVEGSTVSPERIKTYTEKLKSGKLTELRSEFLNKGWGRLSKEGRKSLTVLFEQKTSGEAGVAQLDQRVWNQIGGKKNELSRKEFQQAFAKERMKLSLEQFKKMGAKFSADAKFAENVDKVALERGLTSAVNLKAGGKELSDQSRKTLLKEMKYFLEHYVDRAAFSVTELEKKTAWEEQKLLLRNTLFHDSGKWIHSFFPRSADGLVTATLKTKKGYTWVPILIAIAANGITTFLNNYVTRKKHGGRDYFPGEEAGLPTSGSAAGKPWKGGLA